MVTASDASGAAGAVCASSGITPRAQALLSIPQRQGHSGVEEEVAILSAFDGIGGVRRAFELAGATPALFLTCEIDKEARRVVRRAWPEAVELGDICAIDADDLARRIRSRGRIRFLLVSAGFPCQGMSGLNAFRKGLDDPRSPLVFTLLDLFNDLVLIGFLVENVASGPSQDIAHISEMFSTPPFRIDASDLVHAHRPRLYWCSWNLVPVSYASSENVELTDVKPGHFAHKVRVRIEAPPRPASEWLAKGSAFDGTDEGRRLPPLVLWIPRKKPPFKPAGLASCDRASLKRWKDASFACAPYQFKEKNCILRASGNLEPPTATEREALMGFAKGHTVPCVTSSEAKHEKCQHEIKRRSLLGNSYQCHVVGWLVGHYVVRRDLAARVPSPPRPSRRTPSRGGLVSTAGCHLASLRERRVCCADVHEAKEDAIVYVGRGHRGLGLPRSPWANPFPLHPGEDRHAVVQKFAEWIPLQNDLIDHLGTLEGKVQMCHCRLDQACHADVLALLLHELGARGPPRSFEPGQQLVLLHLRHVDVNGADVRVDAAGGAPARVWLRREIDVDLWKWKVVVRI